MARPVSRQSNITAPIFPVRAKDRFEIHALLAMLADLRSGLWLGSKLTYR